MRMRFKPYARAELLACPFYEAQPLQNRGGWQGRFARPQQPMQLELGCGKGGFLAQLASAHPENNYLGIDITDKVLVLAKRKIEAAYAEKNLAPDNVFITSLDIERIANALSPEDKISRIYINFCNPWNRKASHKKHRLTHTRQLAAYRSFLQDGGEVYFKTDDGPLFEDSLAYFAEAGYEVRWQTRDLHAEEPAWNIRTEHEGMFTAEGIPTKALIAVKRAVSEEELAAGLAKRAAIEKAAAAQRRAAAEREAAGG